MEMPDAIHDDQLVDSSLKKLVLAYMEVVRSLDQEPVFSNYVAFILVLVTLCFCFPLPFFLLIYYAISLHRKNERLGQKTTPAFKALSTGEIPFLKLLVLRYLTRLFVSNHIRSRLKILLASLQGEEIRELFSPDESPARAAWLKTTAENLTKFDTILSRSVKLKFALLIFSLIASLKGGVSLFMDLPKIRWDTIRSLPQLLQKEPDSVFLVQVLGVFAFVVVGWSVLSSFVRKRQFFRSYDVYGLEQRAFSALKLKYPREFPLDLLGIIFGLAIVFLPFLISREFRYSAIGPFVLLVMLLVYVLIRRIRLGNSQRPSV